MSKAASWRAARWSKLKESTYESHAGKLSAQALELLLIADGVRPRLDSMSHAQASVFKPMLGSIIQRLGHAMNQLEPLEFMGSTELKQYLNKCLDTLYEMDTLVRIRVAAERPRKKTDPEFRTALAHPPRKPQV